MTQSIQKFLATSEYRRSRQLDNNRKHGITPKSVSRPIEDSLSSEKPRAAAAVINETDGQLDIAETIREIEESMLAAANNLEFEKAALFRDQIRELKAAVDGTASREVSPAVSYGRKTGRKRLQRKWQPQG